MVYFRKEMGIKKNSSIIFLNPLEVRHYILDIPPVKNSYRKNAVRFSLRSLYPGNEDATDIDYYTVKNITVGIAYHRDKLQQLKTQKKRLVSTAKIISKYGKNGIYVTAGEQWLEILCLKDSIPLFQKCFNPSQIDSITECFNSIMADPSFEGLSPFFLYIDEDSKFKEINVFSDYPHEQFLNVFSEKQCKKQEVFISSGKRTSTNIFLLFFCIFLLAGTLIFGYILYQKARFLEEKASSLYQEYQNTLKNTNQETKSNTIVEVPTLTVKEESLYLLFSELYNASPSMNINTFSIDNGSFRFEADNAKALDVLDYLQNSAFFDNVILHQAVPEENGKERFSISGKIKR